MLKTGEAFFETLHEAIARGQAKLQARREDEAVREQADRQARIARWLEIEEQVRQGLPEILRPYLRPLDDYPNVTPARNLSRIYATIQVPGLAPIRVNLEVTERGWEQIVVPMRRDWSAGGLYRLAEVQHSLTDGEPYLSWRESYIFEDDLELALAHSKEIYQKWEEVHAAWEASRAKDPLCYEPVEEEPTWIALLERQVRAWALEAVREGIANEPF